MSPTAATTTKPQVIKSLAWLEKTDTGEDMKCKTARLNLCIMNRNSNYGNVQNTLDNVLFIIVRKSLIVLYKKI